MKYWLFVMLMLTACSNKNASGYLLKFNDSVKNTCGYKNLKGDTIIKLGKYVMCWTDTFKTYAIVSKAHRGLIAIDRSEKELFQVYNFDNGPDYPAGGLFRIIKNGKFGFADTNGKIVIKPQYGCAFPFENGIAKVAVNCVDKKTGEKHHYWESDKWFYINKSGSKIDR
jgi:hypothetical protein